MKPEKQQLIHDLLGGTEGREAALRAGGRILRRRRQWRVARRGLALTLVLVAAGIWFESVNPRKPAVQTQAQAVMPPQPAQPQALTDDELLALFPDTPVALATLSDGRKRLIFPHPGDEQKFITHF